MYLKDIQGSTTSIVKDDGSLSAAYAYSDFGETEEITGSSFDNEICYTGAVYDDTTGLYYMNARYYDPANGRFISQDTYRGELKNPAQWHLYAYCANNPINYTDPSGHNSKWSSQRPKTGSKIWFCLKTTKKKLKNEIMPYFKRSSTKNEFKNWLVGQITGDLYSLYCDNEDGGVLNTLQSLLPKNCKIYKAVTVLKAVKGHPIVGLIESSMGLGKAFYNGSMHKIYTEIKKYYDTNLKGRKSSSVVYFCTQMKYKRKGREGGYLPTTTVELYMKKTHPHSV